MKGGKGSFEDSRPVERGESGTKTRDAVKKVDSKVQCSCQRYLNEIV